MEYGLLFTKTSTCYKNPDIEYLDETSDYKLKILCKQGKITQEEFQKKHDELERSISYLTKENYGRVYAGGFLRDELLSKKAAAPEKWDNETRKKAITSVIHRHSKFHGTYRKALGHKLVFSVSDELDRTVEDSGLKLDDVLGKEVKRILYDFQNKFHKGEKIGFAWGIHHDTDHRHVHVYLCNRTDKGRHVAMSNPLKGRRPEPGRKDQIGYVKERCIAAQNRMIEQARKMNCHEVVAPENIKIEKNPAVNLSPRLVKQGKELEEQRHLIGDIEGYIKNHKIKMNQEYTEYNFRKQLISQGWEDIRQMNHYISSQYQDLKKQEHVLTGSLLRELGYLSSSLEIRRMSRMILKLHDIAEQERREKVLQEIQYSQEMKTSMLNQLKVLDLHQKAFREQREERKEEHMKARRALLTQKRKYGRQEQAFNYDLYREVTSDYRMVENYRIILRTLKHKRRKKEDFSQERDLLKEFDEEARKKAVQLKYDRFLNKINSVDHQRQIEEENARIEAENLKKLKAWAEKHRREEETPKQIKISLTPPKRDDDQNSQRRGFRM